VLDFVLALIGLIVLAPVLLVVAVLIVREDGRPVFFNQRRVGRYGKDFTMHKFRTMTNVKGKEEGAFDAGDRSRVTRIGRFLRKTKLDELPQLLNVLKGDMALVGPRPEVRKWVAVYPEEWARVHLVRPGITDPASILFRDEEELLAAAEDPDVLYRDKILPRKLFLYGEYVDKHTFWGDLLVIWRTCLVLFTEGAEEPSESKPAGEV
jgi:lipopolysaccharide/colanic/teichoic acid biosynthesis glycosyltransferase